VRGALSLRSPVVNRVDCAQAPQRAPERVYEAG